MRPDMVMAALIVVAVAGLPVITVAEEFGPVKAMKVDAKKAALGKRLFFDKRLSGDAAISWSSCHIPEKGVCDGLSPSKAYRG